VSKQSGIGANLYIAQYDLSGDVGAVTNIEPSRAVLPYSAINQPAEDRTLGRRDGAMSFAGFWNTAAGQAHPVLSALPRTDVIASCFIGSTVGSAAASMVAKQTNYAEALGEDGSLAITVDLVANGYGLEWSGGDTGDGMLTTGKQSFGTGTVSGASIDLGDTDTAFGAAAYLHVFSVASGTATFHVQDSDDDETFADITGLVFTAATGATSQRLQTAAGATIRQYVRIQGTGVHGAAVIACNFIRYAEAGHI
jgi:hypothetical protein